MKIFCKICGNEYERVENDGFAYIYQTPLSYI